MKVKNILYAATAGMAILLPSIHAATSDTTASATTNSADAMTALFGDPVVATGTGVEVKRSQVDQELTGVRAQAAASGREISPEQMIYFEAQILEQLIGTQLILQQANDADRAAGAKKADKALGVLLKSAGSQTTLDMELKANNLTEDQLKKRFTEQATAGITLQRELGVNIPETDVQKYYDTHPDKFEEPEMVHVHHILLMTIDPATGEPLPDDVVKGKRKTADDVLARAHSGEDFSKLAEQYSDDTTTKDKGGDLPPFPHASASADPTHAMAPEFEAAAFSLTNGQISDIVTTRFGYHIIKLIDKIPAKKLTLTDEIPSSDMTVDEWVKEGLAQQETAKLAPTYLAKLKKEANIKILDPDLSAAVESLSNTNTPPTPPEEK
jgi:peptidyl-prolyl cis-trans isomerase C